MKANHGRILDVSGYCIRHLLLTNLVWKLEKKVELDPVGNRVWVVRKPKSLTGNRYVGKGLPLQY